MRQSGEAKGIRDHWYPLVMHQDCDGKRKYYVMDSMGTDRTGDDNVWKLI